MEGSSNANSAVRAPVPPPPAVPSVVVAVPAPAPGVSSSEFKVALLSIGGTVLTAILKAIGVAALASGQWWAIPASLAVTSLGYSIARGLAKRGAVIHSVGAVTVAAAS